MQLLRLVIHRRWWIITPTLVCTAAALLAAVLRVDSWSATQTLVVRDEAAGNRQRGLGRFESNDAMKSAQETILEISRNRLSVAAALRSIGPPAQRDNDPTWPTPEDVSAVQGRILLRAPNGTEFGKSEVILVTAEAETRERAVALTMAICDQLQQRLRDLRLKKSQSIVDELEYHAQLAQSELDRATAAMGVFEAQFGGDLAELRLLIQAGAGDSHLRAQQSAIQKDLRDAEALQERYSQQKELIMAGIRDANHLIATPSGLLESQPALKRMRDDLANAQRICAELEGTLTKEHPRLITAMRAEKQIAKNLHDELQVALRGVESDLELSAQRLATLGARVTDVTQRLERVSESRAAYSNLVHDATDCAPVMERTRNDLAGARANQLAAQSASYLTQLDPPMPGDHPVGPSRSSIVISGFMGGVLLGCGFLFLFTPLGQSSLRRCGDYLPFGRRASDHALATARTRPVAGGRRGTDPTPATAAAANTTSLTNIGIVAPAPAADGWSETGPQFVGTNR
jgi:uncharacterized protein involved in exopolysaccharide biosynthesis